MHYRIQCADADCDHEVEAPTEADAVQSMREHEREEHGVPRDEQQLESQVESA